MAGTSTVVSSLLAFALAASLGPLLGRLGTHWHVGKNILTWLTELRGLFLPFILAPVLQHWTRLPQWAVIGVVIGVTHAICVARWITSASQNWSSSMIGGVALGRSALTLLRADAMARGAVISSLAATTIHVVALEVLLTALGLPDQVSNNSLGALWYPGTTAPAAALIPLAWGLVMASEILAGWLFQARPRSRRSRPEA